MNISPLGATATNVQKNERQSSSKNDIIMKDFQALLLKNIYLKSFYSSDLENEEDEDSESSVIDAKKSNETDDLLLDVLAKKLSEEDIFSFKQYYQKAIKK